jgi:hypothetical protein
VEIGLYLAETGQRLPVVEAHQPDAGQPDSDVLLLRPLVIRP